MNFLKIYRMALIVTAIETLPHHCTLLRTFLRKDDCLITAVCCQCASALWLTETVQTVPPPPPPPPPKVSWYCLQLDSYWKSLLQIKSLIHLEEINTVVLTWKVAQPEPQHLCVKQSGFSYMQTYIYSIWRHASFSTTLTYLWLLQINTHYNQAYSIFSDADNWELTKERIPIWDSQTCAKQTGTPAWCICLMNTALGFAEWNLHGKQQSQ